MLRVSIVEDNANDAKVLQDHLNRYASEKGETINIMCYTSAELFLHEYKGDRDVIFFDIEMPGMNGISAAKKIREMDDSVYIIFITQMAKYAIQGYSVGAFDYFLKPVHYYDLEMRLNRIRLIEEREKKYICIKYDGNIAKVNVEDIIYIESDAHKITFHTTNGQLSYRGPSIKQLEADLKPYGFSRCNTCYIVNLRHCEEITNNEVILREKQHVEISRSRKKQFMDDLMKSFKL